MLNNITLKFNWPTYLVKFISVKYGNRLELNSETYCFRLLLGTKKPALSEFPKTFTYKYATSDFCIDVPKYYIDKADLSYIKNVGSVHFIQFIEGQFKELMVTYVESQISFKNNIRLQANRKKLKGFEQLKGLSVKNSIIEFCAKFDISEADVKLETLIKHIQRHVSDNRNKAA